MTALRRLWPALALPLLVVPDWLLGWPGGARLAGTAAVTALLVLALGHEGTRRRLLAVAGARWTFPVLLAGWTLAGLVLSALALRGLRTANGHDLAYHVQVLWNTLEGRFGEGTVLQELHYDPPLRNDLGMHVSPAFFALLPLFALWPGPGVLLVVQVLVVAAGAVPLHLLARRALGPSSALLVVTAYLLCPPVLGQTTGVFYPALMAGPLLLWAFWAWEQERFGLFVAAAAATLCVREDLGLTLSAFALVGLVARRAPRWVAVPPALGLGWFAACAWLVMPATGGAAVSRAALDWYAGLGHTPGEIVTRAVTDPGHVLGVVLAPAKLHYLWQLLRPLALLPLLGRGSLVALPALGVNLLVTAASPPAAPTAHYSVAVAAAFAVGAVHALSRMRARRGESALDTASLVVLGAALISVPDSISSTTLGRLRRPAHAGDVQAALALVRPHATVAAPGYALPLVATAPAAYASERFGHYPALRPEFVLLDTVRGRFHLVPGTEAAYAARIESFRRDPGYELVFDRAGLLLFEARSGASEGVKKPHATPGSN